MSRSSQTDPPALQRRATDEEARLGQSLPPVDVGAARLHAQPGSATPQQVVTAPEHEPGSDAEEQTQDSAARPEAAAVSDTAATQPAETSAGTLPLDTLDIGPAATPLPPSIIGRDAPANDSMPAAILPPSPAYDEPDAAAVPSASVVSEDAPANGSMPTVALLPSPADIEPNVAAAGVPSASDGGQDAPADGTTSASEHADKPVPATAAEDVRDALANGNVPEPWHVDKPASAEAASPEKPGPPPLPLPQRVALRSVSDGATQSGAADDGFVTPRNNGAAAYSSAPQSPCTDAMTAQTHSLFRRCCRSTSCSPTPVHDTLPCPGVSSFRQPCSGCKMFNLDHSLDSAAGDPVAQHGMAAGQCWIH